MPGRTGRKNFLRRRPSTSPSLGCPPPFKLPSSTSAPSVFSLSSAAMPNGPLLSRVSTMASPRLHGRRSSTNSPAILQVDPAAESSSAENSPILGGATAPIFTIPFPSAGGQAAHGKPWVSAVHAAIFEPHARPDRRASVDVGALGMQSRSPKASIWRKSGFGALTAEKSGLGLVQRGAGVGVGEVVIVDEEARQQRKQAARGLAGLGVRRHVEVSVHVSERDSTDDGGSDDDASAASGRLDAGDTKQPLFANHLDLILNHSLSLCTVGGKEVYPVAELPPQPFGDAARPHTSALTDEPAPPPYDSKSKFSPITTPLPTISAEGRAALIDNLSTWSFDPRSLNADELWYSATLIFEACLRMEGVNVDLPRPDDWAPPSNAASVIAVQRAYEVERLGQLLLAMRSAYHERNAYHNFIHVVDVLQACYSLLCKMGVVPPLGEVLDKRWPEDRKWKRSRMESDKAKALSNAITPMDAFAVCVAAMGHDLGHPGLTNAYMVNAKAPVAQVYGTSILENFHCATLVRMLRKHGFAHWIDDVAVKGDARAPPTDFRKVLVSLVLATDMSLHFAFLDRLRTINKRLGSSLTIGQEDKVAVLCGIMKCGDISNPTRPHTIARWWALRLLDEWRTQAQVELDFHLPVSVMQLDASAKTAVAKSQVGFIDLFVQPLYDGMAGLHEELFDFAENCREGRRTWDKIHQAETEEAAVQAVLEAEATEAASRMMVTESDIDSASSGAVQSAANSVVGTPRLTPTKPPQVAVSPASLHETEDSTPTRPSVRAMVARINATASSHTEAAVAGAARSLYRPFRSLNILAPRRSISASSAGSVSADPSPVSPLFSTASSVTSASSVISPARERSSFIEGSSTAAPPASHRSSGSAAEGCGTGSVTTMQRKSSSASSTSNTSNVGTAAFALKPTRQCAGDCGKVTAKCWMCARRDAAEADAARKRAGGGAPIAPTLALTKNWPPGIFRPAIDSS